MTERSPARPVTRATVLARVTTRATPTIGRGDMPSADARAIGAVGAPNVRMGDRARKAAVKAAPKRWASAGMLDAATLAARRAERDAARQPYSDPCFR